jgi:hypothetical protein
MCDSPLEFCIVITRSALGAEFFFFFFFFFCTSPLFFTPQLFTLLFYSMFIILKPE